MVILASAGPMEGAPAVGMVTASSSNLGSGM